MSQKCCALEYAIIDWLWSDDIRNRDTVNKLVENTMATVLATGVDISMLMPSLDHSCSTKLSPTAYIGWSGHVVELPCTVCTVD